MNDDEDFAMLVKEISEALATHGPIGQKLAMTMLQAAGEVPVIQIAVAITLIKCYLEDKDGREPVSILLDTVYKFIRAQTDAGMGVPQ